MESTSCGANCPFVKQGFCQSEKECPNYVETWWVEPQTEQPRKLQDCSPKRMLLQQQVMQSRLEHVQQALEQSRNKYDELCGYLKTLIEVSKAVVFNGKPQTIEESDEKAIYLPAPIIDDGELHPNNDDGAYPRSSGRCCR